MIDLNPELILIADQLGIFIRLEQLEHFLPKYPNHFYRYNGSLTSPTLGCYEVVLWTVFKHPVEVSEKQMNVMRSHRPPLSDNYRSTKDLNGRQVLYSAGITHNNILCMITLFLLCLVSVL